MSTYIPYLSIAQRSAGVTELPELSQAEFDTRVRDLFTTLVKADADYYGKNQPTLSDFDYDEAKHELLHFEKLYPEQVKAVVGRLYASTAVGSEENLALLAELGLEVDDAQDDESPFGVDFIDLESNLDSENSASLTGLDASSSPSSSSSSSSPDVSASSALSSASAENYSKTLKEQAERRFSSNKIIARYLVTSEAEVDILYAPYKQQEFDHDRPMLSLANVYNLEEMQEFYDSCYRNLEAEVGPKSSSPNPELSASFFKNKTGLQFSAEPKLDGIAVSLTYRNGKLYRALTRGTGDRGKDITEHVKRIPNIVQTLDLSAENSASLPSEIELRGELIMLQEDFDELNHLLNIIGKKPLVNLRNAAGAFVSRNPFGKIERNLKGGKVVVTESGEELREKELLIIDNLPEVMPLRLVVYSINHFSVDDESQLGGKSHTDLLTWAQNQGFQVSNIRIVNSLAEIRSFYTKMQDARLDLGFDIDGTVFKVNNLDYQNNIGWIANSPKWAIAFKFPPLEAKTKLIDIVNSVGRTGMVTPVANVEPTFVSGTTISRLSLNNYFLAKRLDLHQNDTVIIYRGGEVIPVLKQAVIVDRLPNTPKINLLPVCPECGGMLEQNQKPRVDLAAKVDATSTTLTGGNFAKVSGEEMHQVYDLMVKYDFADLMKHDITGIKNSFSFNRDSESSSSSSRSSSISSSISSSSTSDSSSSPKNFYFNLRETNQKIVHMEEVGSVSCTNPCCKGKVLGQTAYFYNKDGIEVKGLGEAIIEQFINLGLITDWTKGFYIQQQEFLDLANEKLKTLVKYQAPYQLAYQFDISLLALMKSKLQDKISELNALVQAKQYPSKSKSQEQFDAYRNQLQHLSKNRNKLAEVFHSNNFISDVQSLLKVARDFGKPFKPLAHGLELSPSILEEYGNTPEDQFLNTHTKLRAKTTNQQLRRALFRTQFKGWEKGFYQFSYEQVLLEAMVEALRFNQILDPKNLNSNQDPKKLGTNLSSTLSEENGNAEFLLSFTDSQLADLKKDGLHKYYENKLDFILGFIKSRAHSLQSQLEKAKSQLLEKQHQVEALEVNSYSLIKVQQNLTQILNQFIESPRFSYLNWLEFISSLNESVPLSAEQQQLVEEVFHKHLEMLAVRESAKEATEMTVEELVEEGIESADQDVYPSLSSTSVIHQRLAALQQDTYLLCSKLATSIILVIGENLVQALSVDPSKLKEDLLSFVDTIQALPELFQLYDVKSRKLLDSQYLLISSGSLTRTDVSFEERGAGGVGGAGCEAGEVRSEFQVNLRELVTEELLTHLHQEINSELEKARSLGLDVSPDSGISKALDLFTKLKITADFLRQGFTELRSNRQWLITHGSVYPLEIQDLEKSLISLIHEEFFSNISQVKIGVIDQANPNRNPDDSLDEADKAVLDKDKLGNDNQGTDNLNNGIQDNGNQLLEFLNHNFKKLKIVDLNVQNLSLRDLQATIRTETASGVQAAKAWEVGYNFLKDLVLPAKTQQDLAKLETSPEYILENYPSIGVNLDKLSSLGTDQQQKLQELFISAGFKSELVEQASFLSQGKNLHDLLSKFQLSPVYTFGDDEVIISEAFAGLAPQQLDFSYLKDLAASTGNPELGEFVAKLRDSVSAVSTVPAGSTGSAISADNADSGEDKKLEDNYQTPENLKTESLIAENLTAEDLKSEKKVDRFTQIPDFRLSRLLEDYYLTSSYLVDKSPRSTQANSHARNLDKSLELLSIKIRSWITAPGSAFATLVKDLTEVEVDYLVRGLIKRIKDATPISKIFDLENLSEAKEFGVSQDVPIEWKVNLGESQVIPISPNADSQVYRQTSRVITPQPQESEVNSVQLEFAKLRFFQSLVQTKQKIAQDPRFKLSPADLAPGLTSLVTSLDTIKQIINDQLVSLSLNQLLNLLNQSSTYAEVFSYGVKVYADEFDRFVNVGNFTIDALFDQNSVEDLENLLQDQRRKVSQNLEAKDYQTSKDINFVKLSRETRTKLLESLVEFVQVASEQPEYALYFAPRYLAYLELIAEDRFTRQQQFKAFLQPHGQKLKLGKYKHGSKLKPEAAQEKLAELLLQEQRKTVGENSGENSGVNGSIDSIASMLARPQLVITSSFSGEITKAMATTHLFSGKAYTNLATELEKYRQLNLAKFLRSLGINGVGDVLSENLINNDILPTIESMLKLDDRSFDFREENEGLKKVAVGTVIRNNILDYFDQPENLTQITELMRNLGMSFVGNQKVHQNEFDGMKVAVTGGLSGLSRNAFAEFIKGSGGTYSSSVTKDTDILVVAGEVNPDLSGLSTKAKKAHQQGTRIMGEPEFMAIYQASNQG